MIQYRLTPWDTKTFQFKTAEVTSIILESTFEAFSNEWNAIEEELKNLNVSFVYTRINASDFQLRNFIQQKGFYFAECSLEISRNKVQLFEKVKAPKIDFVPFVEADIETIKTMARDSFNFSRFHEDATISEEHARNRYFNWIEDLIQQKATIHVGKVGGRIIGFNAQKENMAKLQSDLILAGCSSGSEIYVLSLWNEILSLNKSMGIRKIKTLISASNIGIANVYSTFGFNIENTLLGFHKRIL